MPMRKPKRDEYESKIADIKAKNAQLELDLESTKKEYAEKEKQLVSEWEAKVQELEATHDTETEEKDEEISNLQGQLDRKEAKKLAKAYEEQEVIHGSGSRKWLWSLISVASLLVICTAISIWLSSNKIWYDKFEYYLVDIIFLSAVWFCGAQYTDQVRLRNDYANRKTLAQSFHNILNNLPEDEAIKSKFIEKATDVLCAPNPAGTKEPVLSKKLIKDIAEIVGSIKS